MTLLLAQGAMAQEPVALPDFVLERLDVNPGPGPLTTGGGTVLRGGELRVMLMGHYQHQPLTLNTKEGEIPLLRSRSTGLLSVAFGLSSRLLLDFQIPVMTQREGDRLERQGLLAPTRHGVGSPRVGARAGLLSTENDDSVDLAAEVDVSLPMGTEGTLARGRETSALAKVIVAGQFNSILAPSFEVGVLLRPTVSIESSELETREIGSELRLGAGLMTLGAPLRAEVAINAGLSWKQSRTAAELLAGARYAPRDGVELFAVGGLGLGSEPGVPLFRLLAGVSFSYLLGEDTRPDSDASIVHESVPLPMPDPGRRAGDYRGVQSSPLAGPDVSSPIANVARDRFVLESRVYFTTGSSELPAESPDLERTVEMMLTNPSVTLLTVDGHTDDSKAETFNPRLGRNRAEAVWRYLVEHGVSPNKLRLRSFGPEHPAQSNSTPEGRERNRRVELLLMIPSNQEPTP
ncbi:OmpA family protein [Myxococcus sp. K15C18031901]|uniref:OmpA family protein n=1 Tax=Myxococcus dinghuensis TaxID=2906761 RepID=UPI0020A7DDE3|nr:OmpA family protein [Myxococcus dinghuensis]MCP3101811.1 OmpA family protein [Myxococcus dinghuensis]